MTCYVGHLPLQRSRYLQSSPFAFLSKIHGHVSLPRQHVWTRVLHDCKCLDSWSFRPPALPLCALRHGKKKMSSMPRAGHFLGTWPSGAHMASVGYAWRHGAPAASNTVYHQNFRPACLGFEDEQINGWWPKIQYMHHQRYGFKMDFVGFFSSIWPITTNRHLFKMQHLNFKMSFS